MDGANSPSDVVAIAQHKFINVHKHHLKSKRRRANSILKNHIDIIENAEEDVPDRAGINLSVDFVRQRDKLQGD